MGHPVVELFEGPACPFRFDGEPGERSPRAVEAIKADIRSAIGAGASWVVLGRHEPTSHPDLLDALRQVEELDARAKITSHGLAMADITVLERLRDASLAQLTLVFWGQQETHDRLVGRPGAFETLCETLDLATRINRLLVTVRFVLLSDNADDVGPVVERVRSAARRLELVRVSALHQDRDFLKRHGLGRRPALQAVQAAWEAARVTHLETTVLGFGTFPAMPHPTDTPIQPADRTLLELLRGHVPVPAAMNGTWATPADGDVSGVWYAAESSRSLEELGLQLAAYGCPALDLPPSMGGRGLDRPPGDDESIRLRRREGVPMLLANTMEAVDASPLPAWTGVGQGARIAVVNGWCTDNIMALSTLPCLARALEAHGEVQHHSVWHGPFNPFDLGRRLGATPSFDASNDPERSGWHYEPERVDAMANTPARIAHARKHHQRWLDSIDLSRSDLVVAPGFETGFAVMQHPTLPPDARVIIADFHLGTGLGAWHQHWVKTGRPMDGGWWPSERVLVHALYPRYVRTYWRAGVPLRQLVWRPYPLDAHQFPEGPPVAECSSIFAGGAHQRDWATLAAAAEHAGLADRIQVHTPDAVPAPLASSGEVRLLHFYEALANSRFVVLPLSLDMRRPAGISVISMALAAGRPIVATATAATVDHLRHGHNAILVPPGRPRALAKAMRRLDGDPDLLARLSEGARRSAASVTVDNWAHTMVHGQPEQQSWSMTGDHRGPFYSWP